MDKVVLVNKPLGVTPLQAIYKFKEIYHEYKDEKISYAGRLDPMAEGVLVLLIGDENKKRNEYEQMEKKYEFEVFLGVATDTYDILGKITGQKLYVKTDIEKRVVKAIPEFLGRQTQPFPPYSSKPVNGKPLFWWARRGRLSEIEIPTSEITIKNLKHISTSYLSADEVKSKIKERIRLVEGDFRQEEIEKSWDGFLARSKQSEFIVLKLLAVVSSGTYIRSLAKRIGEIMDVSSLAFSIKRTRVGAFDLSDCIKLD